MLENSKNRKLTLGSTILLYLSLLVDKLNLLVTFNQVSFIISKMASVLIFSQIPRNNLTFNKEILFQIFKTFSQFISPYHYHNLNHLSYKIKDQKLMKNQTRGHKTTNYKQIHLILTKTTMETILSNEFQLICISQYEEYSNFPFKLETKITSQPRQKYINKDTQERIFQVSNQQITRIHQNDQILQQNHQNIKNLEQKSFTHSERQFCFKLKEKYTLPQESQGILFFKQNYESILRAKGLKQTSLCLKQILVNFYIQELNQNLSSQFNPQQSKNDTFTESKQCIPLSILIQPNQIKLWRYNQSEIIVTFGDKPIFPSNPYEDCCTLQRRIWIQVSKKMNKISVHTGDIQDLQEAKTVLLRQPLVTSIQKHNFDWKHCEKTYNEIFQQQHQSQQEFQNPLFRLTHFTVLIKLQIPKEQTQKFSFKPILNPFQYIFVKCLKVETPKKPELKQTPTIFQPQIAQLTCMPPQIKSLYHRLKPLSLLTLCESLSKEFSNLSDQIIGSSIHNSLMTPYGFVNDEKGHHFPIGILNHVLKMKTDRQFKTLLNQISLTETPKQLYKKIINERVGYIRFSLFRPIGCYPGSPAVMQIWPPHYSSPIHNHCQAFGLIKVLMGSIRVENFQDLTFITTNKPYLKSDYIKSQYSWLSQNSFGIHRVINLNPSTAITLQAYYDHNEGADEYFSFIQKNSQNNKKSFSVYYPQHDWENYLNKRSIDEKEDRKFIDSVIQAYGLKNNLTNQIDCSFTKFISVLIKEHDLIKSLIGMDQ